jgi:hypothetical protein
MRITLAFRAFFKALFDSTAANQIESALAGEQPKKQLPQPKPEPQKPEPKPPTRSEAITLLATLQREARLIDFLLEDVDQYQDAQIGAAVRDVHRDSAAVLERLFALAPVVERNEGETIEVPVGFDAGRFRLVGNVAGDPPFTGKLAHHGWQATKCDLPVWSGDDKSAKIVAPADVELG